MERATTPEPGTTPSSFTAGYASHDDLPGFAPLPGVAMRLYSGGRAMMNFVTITAGSEVPWHGHPHEQLGTVLEGEMHLFVGEEGVEPWILRVGDVYAIPPHVRHRALTGPDGATVLDVFAPPREDYIAQATGRTVE